MLGFDCYDSGPFADSENELSLKRSRNILVLISYFNAAFQLYNFS